MPLLTALKRLGFGLLLCTGLTVTQAATSAGQFSVNITLIGTDTGAIPGASVSSGVNTAAQSPPGVCVSETLSEQTNAVVRVVCGTQQFVSITANPNVRFLGANGGAYRFVLNPGSASSGAQFVGQGRTNDFYSGTGTITVTSVRIYNISGTDGPFEMLVTF